jgi:hypothetical protein
MKQTAIEWLEKQFVKLESTIGVHGVMYELMEQSKEMEKQNIINAYKQGQYDSEPIRPTDAEQYYNQTYKQD